MKRLNNCLILTSVCIATTAAYADMRPLTTEQAIDEAIKSDRQEYSQIAIKGQALSPAEKSRLKALDDALKHLNKAKATLKPQN